MSSTLAELDELLLAEAPELSVASLDALRDRLSHATRAAPTVHAPPPDVDTSLDALGADVASLFQQTEHLRAGSAEAESVVAAITREIRSLDTAKRNLSASMTSIKRYQMLVRRRARSN